MEHVPTLAGRVVEALNLLTRGTLRPASERGEFFHERKFRAAVRLVQYLACHLGGRNSWVGDSKDVKVLCGQREPDSKFQSVTGDIHC